MGRIQLLVPLILTVLPVASAEPSSVLWDGSESVREYAKKVSLPQTKSIDLGNGVLMEFVLIPAGSFLMGVPAPVPVDDLHYQTQIWMGIIIFSMAIGVLAAMLAFTILRAIRERHRPQVSLRRLVVLAMVVGAGLLSGLHWRYMNMSFVGARVEYQSSVVRYEESRGKEKPAHGVMISKPFYMGKYEVTREQYKQVMGVDPSPIPDLDWPRHPVEDVSWNNALVFCKRVEELTGQKLRLPSESEWEYACRAGTRTKYYSGDTDEDLDRVAWYQGNSRYTTHPVGGKEANLFGLYDMHGNVWEWCEDDWHDDYKGAPGGGRAWIDEPRKKFRVLRGASWNHSPSSCRSSCRIWSAPDVPDVTAGFRVVCGGQANQ